MSVCADQVTNNKTGHTLSKIISFPGKSHKSSFQQYHANQWRIQDFLDGGRGNLLFG